MENSKSKYRGLAAGAFLISLLAISSCGEVTTTTTPTPASDEPEASESADPNQPAGSTAVILGSSFTDPVGTLSLLPINEPRTATTNVQTTHSDAVVRSFNNRLYVVNRLGADNIQAVDPADFSVPLQCSTGQGTNPQEILITTPSRGYVSLYQPEDNRSADLPVDDLLIVNPSVSGCDGFITGSIDLTPLTAEDNERLARASSMVVIEDRLFVALQDLPPGFVSPDQSGKLAVIDIRTNAIEGSVTLTGRNPVSINRSGETGMIYVADADYVDTTSPHGGIERVDPETLEARMWIDDLALGGAPGDIETSGSKGFAAVSFFDENFNFVSKVVSFDLNQEGTPTEIYRSQGFIQDIEVDENGVLLVGDRDPMVNGILFIDPETGNVIDGPINTGSPPSSITFVNR